MASDDQVARVMRSYLVARGYQCGQKYAELGGVVRDIKAQFSDETEATLLAKAKRVATTPAYSFKSRTVGTQTEISASDPPKCGN